MVTDKFLEGLHNGAVEQTLASLKAAGVAYAIYDGVEPNPKIHNIQAAKAFINRKNVMASSLLAAARPMTPARAPGLF